MRGIVIIGAPSLENKDMAAYLMKHDITDTILIISDKKDVHNFTKNDNMKLISPYPIHVNKTEKIIPNRRERRKNKKKK